MSNKILSLIFLILMGGGICAQTIDPSDVRVVDLKILSLDQIVLEPSQGLQSEIYFNLTLNPGAGTLVYEPDPQIGGGPVILQSGMNGPFDFLQDTKDQTCQIRINLMDNAGNIIAPVRR